VLHAIAMEWHRRREVEVRSKLMNPRLATHGGAVLFCPTATPAR